MLKEPNTKYKISEGLWCNLIFGLQISSKMEEEFLTALDSCFTKHAVKISYTTLSSIDYYIHKYNNTKLNIKATSTKTEETRKKNNTWYWNNVKNKYSESQTKTEKRKTNTVRAKQKLKKETTIQAMMSRTLQTLSINRNITKTGIKSNQITRKTIIV